MDKRNGYMIFVHIHFTLKEKNDEIRGFTGFFKVTILKIDMLEKNMVKRQSEWAWRIFSYEEIVSRVKQP